MHPAVKHINRSMYIFGKMGQGIKPLATPASPVMENQAIPTIQSQGMGKVIQMAKRVVKIAFGEIVDAGYQFESP